MLAIFQNISFSQAQLTKECGRNTDMNITDVFPTYLAEMHLIIADQNYKPTYYYL